MRRLLLIVVSLAVVFATAMAPGASAGEPDPPQVDAAGTISPTVVPQLQVSVEVFQGIVDSVTPQPETSASALQPSPKASLREGRRGEVTESGFDVDPIGWALSAIGIAVTAATSAEEMQELQQISQQLTQVQQTLTQIQAQLTQISNQIAALSAQLAATNCSVQTQAATSALANVQSAAQSYLGYVEQAATATDPTQTPSVQIMKEWALNYTLGETSLQESLNDISDVVTGSTSDGSLQACAQALYSTTPSNPALGYENTYYSNLYLYVSYWYQAQVIALGLYVEAQHLLAMDAAGNASSLQATDPQVICDNPVNSTVTSYCNAAAQQVGDTYSDISKQLSKAGAPYIWGTGGQVSAPSPAINQGPGNYAWLLDINQFQAGNCAQPLSSAPSYGKPCGGTVGTTTTFGNSTFGNYTWGSYSTWQPAPSKAWYGVLAAATQQLGTYAQAMVATGFGNQNLAGSGVSNLIILTGESTTSTPSSLNQQDFQNSVTGLCVMDTSFYSAYPNANLKLPLCDSQGGTALGSLISNYDSSYKSNGYLGQWSNPTSAPYSPSNAGYYTASAPGCGKELAWGQMNAPGWMSATQLWLDCEITQYPQYKPTAQYRWPVLPITSSMCTNSMTTATDGGAYTMCGADFQAWLAANLPTPPPNSSPPTAVWAEHSAQGAAVSWQPPKGSPAPSSYVLQSRRNNGNWRTVTEPMTSSDVDAQSAGATHSTKVKGLKRGNYSFRVASAWVGGRSDWRKSERREFVPGGKYSSRYYTFRKSGKVRVAEAFSDGRVYWVAKKRTGFGWLDNKGIKGHWAKNPVNWAGSWKQRSSGSWRNLAWDGWRRADGPARSRAGMPLKNRPLPTS